MFNSQFLQKFNIAETIQTNKYNFFYTSYQFTLIKEHILDNSNYESLLPRLYDIIYTIDLGVTNNINASFTAIQLLLTFFRNEIYTLENWQLFEVNLNLKVIIEKIKSEIGSDLLETKNEQFHKEYVLNQITEISNIADELIKINTGGDM